MMPKAVADALGYQLDASTYASIDDLNSFPPSLIAEARRLLGHKELYALTYVRHFSPRESVGDVQTFVREVVGGGEPPSTWRRGDQALSLRPDFPPMLAVDADEAVRLLQSVENAEPTWIQTPTGAPGVVVRNTTYRWWPPNGFDNLLLPPGTNPPVIDEFRSVYRRWLTAQFANWWFNVRDKAALPTTDELGDLSVDMHFVLAALRQGEP